MAHRDALGAAHAKIAALEAALEDARAGHVGDDALRAEVARLEMLLSAAHAEQRVLAERAEHAEHELQQMRAEKVRIAREVKALERQELEREEEQERTAAAPAPRRGPGDPRKMVGLDHHNLEKRLAATPKGAIGAGVLCPACVERGERVELIEGNVTQVFGSVSMQHVLCLRCGHLGARRLS